MELFELTGKNAVVIGGAGGIGQSISQGLATAGANVAIASRNEKSLKRSQVEIKERSGKEISYYVADACDEASVKALAANTVKDMGKVDILICAQGINKKIPIQEFPVDVFRQMLEVNVTSIMLCCKYFGSHMINNHYGKIVILSSVRGKIASRIVGNVGYTTTKGAVDMMMRQIAAEYGQYGITVNAIAPTITETKMMTETINQRGGDSYRKALADNLPLKRMARPEDCIGSVIFLSSPASDFMTGQVLYPDGGLTSVG